jgi:hypothetical protein
MRNKITVLTISVLIAFTAYAQDYTDKARLLELSEQYRIEAEAAKQQAEAKARDAGIPIVIRSDSVLMELMAWPDGGVPMYYTTNNANAAKTMSTDKVYSGGGAGYSLTGSGVLLGEWDGGSARTTHQEVYSGGVSRITIKDGGSEHYHSVHVSGTMIASGAVASAKGMSPAATLHSYEWTSDESEMAASAANDNLRVSNHSYGTVTGFAYGDWGKGSAYYWFGWTPYSSTEDYNFGFYAQDASDWDNIAYNAPHYLICKSAGNDRNDSYPGGHYYWDGTDWAWSTDVRDKDGGTDGYDCIPTEGNAKNILTVGAVNDITTGWTQASDVVMSSFSGWGPTDDGRIKPDIVTNGIGLYSCYTGADNAYASLNGTSMACPAASGSIGLLIEHRRNLVGTGSDYLSSTVKGLICHTADEAGTSIGPDYSFGWGLMNTESCVEKMTENDNLGYDYYIQEKDLANSDTHTFNGISDGTEPVKVTICWTDPKGTPVTSNYLNNRTAMLVNDLDIRVSKGGTDYEPWVLDPDNPSNAATTGDNTVDNVEQVYIASPSAGAYTITVDHKGTLASNQKYSIIISGLDPQPRLPEDETVNLSLYPKFEWPEIDGAINYEIKISDDSGMGNMIIQEVTNNLRYYYLSQNVLNGGTTYYWAYREQKSDQTWGTWSDVWEFTSTSGCDSQTEAQAIIKMRMEGLWNNDAHTETPVLVQLRTPTSVLNTSAAVVEVPATVNTSGIVDVKFPSTLTPGNYWLVITAPGYMPLATSNQVVISTSITLQYDFTISDAQATAGTEVLVDEHGVYYLRAGDYSGDYIIDGTDGSILESFGGKSVQGYFK